MGVLSQFTSLLNFLNFLLPLGLPTGIIKHIAQNPNSNTEIFSSVIKILFYPSILFFLIIFFFSKDISVMLFGNTDYYGYVKFLCIFIPFIMIYNIYEAYVKGIKDINIYVKTLIFSSVISLAASVPLTYFFGLIGSLIGLLINYISFILILYILLKRKKLTGIFNFKSKIDKKFIKDISKISIAILFAGSIHQISIIILKRITIENFGTEGNGLFQSVYNISIFYFGFIFTSLSSYSFPKISGITGIKELNEELINTLRFILVVLIPLISFLIVFRNYIILILYTNEFSNAESLFKYQFAGDLFKALSWVLGLWLIPRSKIFVFLILDIILNVNLISIYLLMLNYFTFNLDSVSISYLCSYFLHFILNLAVTMKILNFTFSISLLKLLISSILSIFLITLATININAISYLMVFIVMVVWAFLNFKRADLEGIGEIFKQYFKK
ncbi:MAG: Lipid III flippase [Ignavibacteria bacterium]|nr:Lipid III flippase [Ignavibacteria bacterium]